MLRGIKIRWEDRKRPTRPYTWNSYDPTLLLPLCCYESEYKTISVYFDLILLSQETWHNN